MRLVEVTIRPGETTPMHGHPYPSVMAFNSVSGAPAEVTDEKLNPTSSLKGQGGGFGRAPNRHNLKAPTCGTTRHWLPCCRNGGKVPVHYYRIEYKRIDGDEFAQNWKKWYPWMQYMQSHALNLATKKPVGHDSTSHRATVETERLQRVDNATSLRSSAVGAPPGPYNPWQPFGPQPRRPPWPVRNPFLPWGRGHGRGLSRPRHEAGSRRRDRRSARRVRH